jgi:FkbM family methyltransferase
MRQYAGIWFPDDEGTLTKAMMARLDSEDVYRGDRLVEAMKVVPGRGVAVDAGANVGMWTRELAKAFKRVIAIEPNAANAECLDVNTAQFTHVAVVRCALGEVTGTIAMETKKGNFSATVAPGGSVDDKARVPMMRLDELGLEACDYLKVHVNGYELQALKGAVETLRRCKPVLTVVLKPKLAAFELAPEDVIAWLEGQGYRLAGGQKPYRIFVKA